MSLVKKGVISIVTAAAMSAMLAIPAQGASGSGSGGGNSSGGTGGSSSSGSVYADMTVDLRAADGSTLLKAYQVPSTSGSGQPTTEYCAQPVSLQPVPGINASLNPVDGRQVWVIPLQGEWLTNPPDPLPVATISACDPQPQYAMFVSDVNMERLNQARSTDSFLATKLAAVTAKLLQGSSITLESTGRISIDGVPIDAPPENAAVYQSLMLTGTVPGLPAGMAGPPALIGPTPAGPNSNSQFDAWELAAAAIGAAASKDVPVTVDTVEYYNRILGFPPSTSSSGAAYVSPWGVSFVRSVDPGTGVAMTTGEQFIDYSGFSYNRSQTFTGSVTWLDVPTMTWKVSRIADVVPFTNLSSYPEIGDRTLHGVVAFAQLADDVRALCNFIPDNTFIPGFFMDVPGTDTTAAQLRTIVDPAVGFGSLPASAFETYPFHMTASLLNPFAGSAITDARMRVTVHAPEALNADDVTVVAADGQPVTFGVGGSDLVGWWGPPSGFPVPPGYNVSTDFAVTVADHAPTGVYQVTLDLVRASDPSQVLASTTASTNVLANQPTVLWGPAVPKLATEGVAMALPLQVYSPAETGGRLALDVSGPPTLGVADVSVYGSNGAQMVAMPLTLDASGHLVGTWDVSLAAGYTPVTWYATVAVGAPVGIYSFGVGLQGANTLAPSDVSVVAPESHGQKPPGAGEDTTAPTVTVTAVGTPAATASFALAADETNVSYTCQLFVDGVAQPPEACTSPVSFRDLQPAVYVLAVTGTDAAGNVSTPVIVTWTVGAPASGVVITSAPSGTLTVGQSGSVSFSATGPAPLQLAAVGALPAGVTFTDNGDGTATLGGAAVAGTEGTYELVVVAWSGNTATSQTFVLTVAAATTAPGTTSPGTQTSGPGYWLVASDGGVFAFGDAGFYGSAGSVRLAAPIVGMAASSDGRGYWLVASDGGVFAFGDAGFYGSAGSVRLAAPVVGLERDRQTGGYWLVGSDGGVFGFGAPFAGSAGALPLRQPVVVMSSAA
ncbi:MAG: hypothetical protein KGQ66_02710 [Acidobacteriota bacterium]|nr:hypothetical protein [Acidobacteriota bacterium]